jgi:CRISPR-associated endoribonuclease Cas6
MDLLSLILTLRPTQPAPLPPRLGRAAHAILLARIDASNPTLAQELHDSDGPKPFTCSNLMGPREGDLLSPEQTYTLRYTALTASVAEELQRLFTPGDLLTFEGLDLSVEATAHDPEEHPWAGSDDYQALAARHLLPSQPVFQTTWPFLLASPTAFQSQGLTQALPLPALFFGSLVQRWNAFAPLALPADEVRRYAEEMVVVSRFSLRSAPGWERGRGMRIGAIGKVTYRALNRDRYWLAVLSALAEYARYAGVGAMTTAGMGQVRKLEKSTRPG